MKLSTLLLTLSLAANLLLAAVIVTHRSDSASAVTPVAAGTAGADAKNPAPPAPGANAAAGAAVPAPKRPAGAPSLWVRIHSGNDLAATVARLRQAGFPPAVIRRVIATLVNEQFDARRLAIEKDNLDAPFWAKSNSNVYTDPKIGPELRKMQMEQLALLKKVLGGDLNDLIAETEDQRAMVRLQIGSVRPEKLDALYEYLNGYYGKQAEIYGAANSGAMLPADRDKIAAMDRGMRDDLLKFLTPAEADDVVLRLSTTSQQLRSFLTPLNPTEAEYRAIYPAYQAFVDAFPSSWYSGNNLPPDQAANRKVAEDAMYNQLRASLSPDRFADLQQVLNPQYSMLNRLVARLDLPLSAAKQVADVQQDIQQRVTALRMDPSVPGNERNSQLTALSTEANAKVTSILGQRGLDAYKQYGGNWLTYIAPRQRAQPAPAAAAPATPKS